MGILNLLRRPPPNVLFKATDDGGWFSAWSNNFEDREGELFSSAALDEYIDAVDNGLIDPPELWFWHEPLRLGVAEWVGRVGAFAVAGGRFDDTDAGQAAKAFLRKNRWGVSQGYLYHDDDRDEDGVYHAFRAFEISVLPPEHAANPYTFIEGGSMPLDDSKMKALQTMFGDKADDMVKQLERQTAALQKTERYKAFLGTPAPKPANTGRKEDFADMLIEVVEVQAEIAETQAALVGKLDELAQAVPDELSEKMKGQDERISAIVEAMAALQTAIAELQAEMTETPRAASAMAETMVENDEAGKALKTKAAAQQNPIMRLLELGAK
jgi:hypothetical protein